MDVSRSLSKEKSTPKILDLILEKSVENINCDGASIYLIEKIKQDTLGGKQPPHREVLHFLRCVNRSQDIRKLSTQRYLEVDPKSIAGYVALSGESLNIRDVYVQKEGAPYQFNPSFDKLLSYRTKSTLTVPIKTAKGRVLGALQLINKLKNSKNIVGRLSEKNIIAFSDHDDQLMESFAAQAAIALENAKLTESISELFESFVRASVTAIEARDPSTSGHSDRVAILTVEFATLVDRIDYGKFKKIKFNKQQIREIRYAALLHDFGKIAVREDVLLKAKKLYPPELETIQLRLKTLKMRNELQIWKDVAENMSYLAEHKKLSSPQAMLGEALLKIDNFNRQLKEIQNMIYQANESQIVQTDFDIKRLMSWIEAASRNFDQLVLTENEMLRLSIPKGTLTETERKEIQSHVQHSFIFLSQIAWTEDLSAVPTIAHAHHEKLDGSGYPRGLSADEIPVQSRIMTIGDIYDALTAMDRPYKNAVTSDRALDILSDEAKNGQLDKDLLKHFIEAKIYKKTTPLPIPGKIKKVA